MNAAETKATSTPTGVEVVGAKVHAMGGVDVVAPSGRRLLGARRLPGVVAGVQPCQVGRQHLGCGLTGQNDHRHERRVDAPVEDVFDVFARASSDLKCANSDAVDGS